MDILNNKKGIALTVAIIVIVMLMIVAAAILATSYNNKRLADIVATKRTIAYYRAQAGIVDAQWRLRTDPGGLFAANGPNWSPQYGLDIDASGNPNEVTVTIGPVINADTGQRQISATVNE